MGRIRAKGGVSNHVYFVPDTVWGRGVWGTAQPKKIYNFDPYLSLETVSLALNLPQNCYINMRSSFSWKLVI